MSVYVRMRVRFTVIKEIVQKPLLHPLFYAFIRQGSSSFDGNLQPKFNETLGTCSLAEVIGSVLSLQTKSKMGKQRKWQNHWKGKTPFNKKESTIQAVTMASNRCVILNNSLPCRRHQWTNTAGESWQNKTRKSCIYREPQFPLMSHSFLL